jgi:hypothetical protein
MLSWISQTDANGNYDNAGYVTVINSPTALSFFETIIPGVIRATRHIHVESTCRRFHFDHSYFFRKP